MKETLLPDDGAADITNHQQARAQGRELQRRNVIQTAYHLLQTEGAGAITVRRLAKELNCSTKVIYTMFGSKDGLANALYVLGFDRLRQAIAAAEVGESPHNYLANVAAAYWDFALANPNLYAVMFSRAIPDYIPDEETRRTSEVVLSDVIAVVMQFEAQVEHKTAYHAMNNARAFWMLMHGGVSLYMAGHLEGTTEARALYDFSIRMLLAGMFPAQ